ncbi:MAG: rod shape-determining protein MreC [bacterium]|nr:rod shape-determining protein MreC [bacterium]
MPAPGSPMRDFLTRHREGLLLAVLVILSLIAISRQVRDPTGLSYFRRSVITVISPFQAALGAVVGGVNGFWNDYLFLVDTRTENELLREEINRLRSEIQEVREELYRAGRLEEFAIYRSEAGLTGMAARVIGESPDPWTRTIVVNRGSEEGVERGMPVVVPDGLVGRVMAVAPHSSIVRLIIDRSSRVPVLASRSRARAVLEGENSGTCQLKYLDRTEDVREEDTVITSGLAGVYPRGIEIGKITQVLKKNYGLYQYAKMLPKAPLTRLEDVLIIRPQPVEIGE